MVVIHGGVNDTVILLMDKILHQLIGSLSHYLQGFIHPRWCRISSISSIIAGIVGPQKMLSMTTRYRVGIVPTPILQNPSFPQLGYDGM